MTPELAAAVDALYETFARYERPATFRGCGCCFEGTPVPGEFYDGTQRPLVEVASPGGTRPLRELTEEDGLEDIITDVPLTGGDQDLLKHYLPRFCEIAAVGDGGGWMDLMFVCFRLVDRPETNGTPWWTWPSDEVAGVRAYLDAVWASARRSDSLWGCASTLDALLVAEAEPERLFRAWADDEDLEAQRNLAECRALLAAGDVNDLFGSPGGREPPAGNHAALMRRLTLEH